jgi:hypothetical protein
MHTCSLWVSYIVWYSDGCSMMWKQVLGGCSEHGIVLWWIYWHPETVSYIAIPLKIDVAYSNLVLLRQKTRISSFSAIDFCYTRLVYLDDNKRAVITQVTYTPIYSSILWYESLLFGSMCGRRNVGGGLFGRRGVAVRRTDPWVDIAHAAPVARQRHGCRRKSDMVVWQRSGRLRISSSGGGRCERRRSTRDSS